MLPPGFHWNETRDGLLLRGITLIRIDLQDWPVPVHNLMREGMRGIRFFSTHGIAVRHAETWTCKREQDIRLFVGHRIGVAGIERRRAGMPTQHAGPSTGPTVDVSPCQHERGRGWTRVKVALPDARQSL